MVYQYLLTEQKNNIMIIYLNRPETLNAIVPMVLSELLHVLEEVENDHGIKAIIITGKGKAFSAGGDLNMIKNIKPLEGRKVVHSAQPFIYKMLEIEKPIIAAVNGPAAGAGFSLPLLCDLIVASERSYFVQSFVNIGLIPDLAALYFLPSLIGSQKAKEIMLLGEKVSAQEAYRIGMINEVTTHDELLPKAIYLAEKLANKPPIAVGLTKTIVNRTITRDLKYLLELEGFGQDLCFQTEDFKEGVSAFIEKREPHFMGK